MDVLSGDYSKPEVVVTTSNQITITHANLNAMCLNKDLLVGVPNQVKVRVKTSLKYNALPTYSKEEILTITPFEDLVIPLPPSNELYLQGSAVPTNWGYPLPVSQKLTKDPNKAVFTITTTLTGGKELVFLSVNGFYGNPAYKALTSSQPLVGGLFTENKAPNWLGSNIIIPPATGVYKVTVNFVSGTFSIVKQ
ncbi:MAG TPA: hypothetical protein DDZ41_01475 [Flavobacterium sp.]|nr:hypothetical protein [Flavobacterium sp.]